MATSAGGIFTGASQFSGDFQQVVQRAVQFASLPMQLMQNEVTGLQAQSAELTTLGSRFAAVQSAIANLAGALGAGSYAASATQSAAGADIATVALSGSPGVGTYTLEVDGSGSFATAMSSDGTSVTDPAVFNISDAGAFTLSVGAATTLLTPATHTLSGLADAINLSGAGVQATLVNVGNSTTPDYRLSLQNTKLARVAIQLQGEDGSSPGTALMSAQAPGAPATYRVNGKPASESAPLESDSSTITLSPGVAVTMQSTGTTTITVSRGSSAVSGALRNLATAYNAAQSEIDSNRGQGKGALQGQSVLMSLSGALRQIANYSTGTPGISSLTSLGLSFDQNGMMSFDSTVFAAATTDQIPALANFLGSLSGGGFLRAANDALNGLTDSTSGMIQTGIHSIQDQISHDNESISAQQELIDLLQTTLNRSMASADAAIASMEQQYTYMYNMFQAMQVNARNGY